jgi:hypothetical protein
MTDFEFIREYKNMKAISDVCEELGLNYANLIQEKSSKEKEKQVSLLLKAEIVRMYNIVLGEKKNEKTNSL